MSNRTDEPIPPDTYIVPGSEVIPPPPADFVPRPLSERETARIRANRRPTKPLAPDLVIVRERG